MKNIVIPVMCCALSIAVAMYLQINAVQGKAQKSYETFEPQRQERIAAINASIASGNTGGSSDGSYCSGGTCTLRPKTKSQALEQQLLNKVLVQEQEMREMRENQAELLDQIKQLQQSQFER